MIGNSHLTELLIPSYLYIDSIFIDTHHIALTDQPVCNVFTSNEYWRAGIDKTTAKALSISWFHKCLCFFPKNLIRLYTVQISLFRASDYLAHTTEIACSCNWLTINILNDGCYIIRSGKSVLNLLKFFQID